MNPPSAPTSLFGPDRPAQSSHVDAAPAPPVPGSTAAGEPAALAAGWWCRGRAPHPAANAAGSPELRTAHFTPCIVFVTTLTSASSTTAAPPATSVVRKKNG